jgi:hypothetical protein
MQSRRSKTVRMASALLVGGVATGFLLAMTVPTTMRAHAGDSWRELMREPASSSDPVAFAAAPEDLTPVYWQAASADYPTGPDPWRDPSLDWPQEDAAALAEPLPAELLETRDNGVTVELVEVDDAASTAQAAHAAALDVRTIESAVVEEATPPPVAPQAVTVVG